MKRFRILSSLFLVPTVSCAPIEINSEKQKKSEQVDVVIISGQSNAAGFTHNEYLVKTMGQSKYDEYAIGYSSIKIAFDCWSKYWPAEGGVSYSSDNHSFNNQFVNTMLGEGSTPQTFGPEVGIAEKLHNRNGRKIFLIKYACGATCLKEDWSERSFKMYCQLINYINKEMNVLKSQGFKPIIKAFCWMQGEGDAFDGYYEYYLNNLRTFVRHVKEDLKLYLEDNKMPFIDAGISDSVVWPKYSEINNAKKVFADEDINNIYVDTISAGMTTSKEPEKSVDLYHYDSDSEITLGHLFADEIAKFL